MRLTACKGFIVCGGKVITPDDLTRYSWARDDELVVDLDDKAKAVLADLGLPTEGVQPEIIAAANAIIARRRRAELRRVRRRG